jgi:hypothetical protein
MSLALFLKLPLFTAGNGLPLDESLFKVKLQEKNYPCLWQV